MASVLRTASAVGITVISFGLLASNVVLAGMSHVQEAAAVHVQEAEIQLLESAGMETVVIDGEVAHVL